MVELSSPRAWAICLALGGAPGGICFMVGPEDKHRHLYVTCCNINANLYFVQNFLMNCIHSRRFIG